MKKIMLITMMTVLAVALGVAYAGEGAKMPINEFTDISGKTYNTTWDLNPVFGGDVRSESVEGSNAGGLREGMAGENLDKDFFSPTYNTTSDVLWGLNAPEASEIRSGSVESSHAGGSRAAEEMKLDKDFISPTYDTMSDVL